MLPGARETGTALAAPRLCLGTRRKRRSRARWEQRIDAEPAFLCRLAFRGDLVWGAGKALEVALLSGHGENAARDPKLRGLLLGCSAAAPRGGYLTRFPSSVGEGGREPAAAWRGGGRMGPGPPDSAVMLGTARSWAGRRAAALPVEGKDPSKAFLLARGL